MLIIKTVWKNRHLYNDEYYSKSRSKLPNDESADQEGQGHDTIRDSTFENQEIVKDTIKLVT